MAYLDPARPASLSASGSTRALRAASLFRAVWRRWSAARRRDQLLRSLKERDLNDIGLNRADRIGSRYSPYSARV